MDSSLTNLKQEIHEILLWCFVRNFHSTILSKGVQYGCFTNKSETGDLCKNICRDWDRCESCKHEISVQIMLDLVDKSCLFYTKPANVLAYQWDGKYSDISCLFIYAKQDNCNQFNKLPTHNCVLLVLPVYKSFKQGKHLLSERYFCIFAKCSQPTHLLSFASLLWYVLPVYSCWPATKASKWTGLINENQNTMLPLHTSCMH